MNRPDGIVDRLIDQTTGRPATPGDADAIFEYFRNENAPEPRDEELPGLELKKGEDSPISTELIF